jgi:primosomal protein N' (replication factor Y)
MQLVDMTNYQSGKGSIISPPARQAIEEALRDQKRILLFLNRRSITKTFKNKQGLTVDKMTMGVERLAKDLEKQYPQAKIAIVHKDIHVIPEHANVVIATQAVLKFRRSVLFDTVIFLNFDAQLMHFEFRAQERAFSLLIALRLMAQRRIFVQTHIQDDHVLKAARSMNFTYFLRQELRFRREIGLPPFKHMVTLWVRSLNEELVHEQSQSLHEVLKTQKPSSIAISDPFADLSQRFPGRVCFAINVKGKSVPALVKFCKKVLKDFKRKSSIIITMVVDP